LEKKDINRGLEECIDSALMILIWGMSVENALKEDSE
jgi:hypothetical protein